MESTEVCADENSSHSDQSPSCWVIFQSAHDVFRSVVNEMEYDIRSRDVSRHEQFPNMWRKFQKYATLHADMEECGFFRLLEGNSNKINSSDLVSWELHQADSDAAMKVDNMLAQYQGREVFDKILSAFVSWQDIHLQHLDYEDKMWAPVVGSFDMDILRRNQIFYQMVTFPAHARDPNLCSEYYGWLTKNLSLYGTPTMNSMDSTINFVRGLRCVCDPNQWKFYLPAIHDACTYSIWEELVTHYQIESPDIHAHLLSDHSIFTPSTKATVPEASDIENQPFVADNSSGQNSASPSKKWSISLVDVNLARASFAMMGTKGSFFQSKKIIPGTEWWLDGEINSGKETAAILSNSQSFRSHSLTGMDSKKSLYAPSSSKEEETSTAGLHLTKKLSASAEVENEDDPPTGKPSYRDRHMELDEFHFNQHILPFNPSKPSFHLRREVSTMPIKLRNRPNIGPPQLSMHQHYVHPAPLRSRVFSNIFFTWDWNCCGTYAAIDDTAHNRPSTRKKKSSKKKKKRRGNEQDPNSLSISDNSKSENRSPPTSSPSNHNEFTNIGDHQIEE